MQGGNPPDPLLLRGRTVSGIFDIETAKLRMSH